MPLDEYPKRCGEQLATNRSAAEEYKTPSVSTSNRPASTPQHHYELLVDRRADAILRQCAKIDGLTDNLPQGKLRGSGFLPGGCQPAFKPDEAGTIPHLAAMMQTNINVQTLLTEKPPPKTAIACNYAAMMDPHTAVRGASIGEEIPCVGKLTI